MACGHQHHSIFADVGKYWKFLWKESIKIIDVKIVLECKPIDWMTAASMAAENIIPQWNITTILFVFMFVRLFIEANVTTIQLIYFLLIRCDIVVN